jgi:RecB family exonuclease
MSKFSLALDSTQINTFLECEQKWKLSKEIVPIDNFTKPMDKGTVMHFAIESYYRHLYYHPSKTTDAQKFALDEVLKRSKEFSNSLTEADLKFVLQRFSEYILFYAAQGDFETASYNCQPAIEIGFSIELVNNDLFLFVLEGRIDRIAKSKNGFEFFVDFKTQSAASNLYRYRIQFKNYALASELTRGMIDYIGMQKVLGENMLRREMISFSPIMLRRWKEELITIFYRASNCIQTGLYGYNWSSCEGKYSRLCNYHELCEQQTEDMYIQIKQNKFTQAPIWSPWK